MRNWAIINEEGICYNVVASSDPDVQVEDNWVLLPEEGPPGDLFNVMGLKHQDGNWIDTRDYVEKRKVSYPDVGDQLDDLFKQGSFSTEMTSALQEVKDKYPKD
jgi:hypothetical protein